MGFERRNGRAKHARETSYSFLASLQGFVLKDFASSLRSGTKGYCRNIRGRSPRRGKPLLPQGEHIVESILEEGDTKCQTLPSWLCHEYRDVELRRVIEYTCAPRGRVSPERSEGALLKTRRARPSRKRVGASFSLELLLLF